MGQIATISGHEKRAPATRQTWGRSTADRLEEPRTRAAGHYSVGVDMRTTPCKNNALHYSPRPRRPQFQSWGWSNIDGAFFFLPPRPRSTLKWGARGSRAAPPPTRCVIFARGGSLFGGSWTTSFLARPWRTVHWLNDNRHEALLKMCTNQKERARDVIRLQGAKTKWREALLIPRAPRSRGRRSWPRPGVRALPSLEAPPIRRPLTTAPDSAAPGGRAQWRLLGGGGGATACGKT